MAKREFKPRVRGPAVRDARLIIIATEGIQTEVQYFNALKLDERYRNSKVHVEVLERPATDSSPQHVMDMLRDFEAKFSLNEYDELWLVIDLDRWGDKKISDIAAQCVQKRYQLAASNPCFEIWLLLHVTSLDHFTTDELKRFEENKKETARSPLELELIRICGEFNKSNLNESYFMPHVETAVVRAKAVDIHPDHRWPNQLGTRVYLLVESIMRHSRQRKE